MLVSVFALTTYSSLDNIVHLEAVLLKLGSIFGEKRKIPLSMKKREPALCAEGTAPIKPLVDC